MFTPSPNKLYTMPAHFGEIDNNQQDTAPTGWYHDVTVIAVSYITDREAIARYLPSGFEPTSVPVITVYYCCNKQVDWLAGHGYKMIGVGALVAQEVMGQPNRLLEPFRFSRYTAGKLHPVSNSPYPWS